MTERNVKICNLNREKHANEELFKRNLPSTWLKPNFDIYPVPTKYTSMQLMDQRGIPTVQIMNTKPYDPSIVFNPGTSKAPREYLINNIDVESKLRNQIFALQKCDQREYVPEVSSDLYMNYVHPGKELFTPFTNLQYKNKFNDTNPDRCNLAPEMFNNHTRTNVKK